MYPAVHMMFPRSIFASASRCRVATSFSRAMEYSISGKTTPIIVSSAYVNEFAIVWSPYMHDASPISCIHSRTLHLREQEQWNLEMQLQGCNVVAPSSPRLQIVPCCSIQARLRIPSEIFWNSFVSYWVHSSSSYSQPPTLLAFVE